MSSVSKSRLAMIICLVVNAIIESILPITFIVVLFMMTMLGRCLVLGFLLATMFASAIIANVAAGYNLKTRWYAIILPPLVLIASWMITFKFELHADSLDTLLAVVFSAALLAVSLISSLVTAKRQSKKLLISDKNNNGTTRDNNETIQL